LLLNHEANVNLQDSQGKTALRLAIENDNVDMIKLLMANKANVTLGDLAQSKSVEVRQELQLSPNFIDTQDINGDTLLINAAKEKNYKRMESLISHEANPLLQNLEGKTALYYLADQIVTGPGYDNSFNNTRTISSMNKFIKNKNNQPINNIFIIEDQNHITPLSIIVKKFTALNETDSSREIITNILDKMVPVENFNGTILDTLVNGFISINAPTSEKSKDILKILNKVPIENFSQTSIDNLLEFTNNPSINKDTKKNLMPLVKKLQQKPLESSDASIHEVVAIITPGGGTKVGKGK
jgi:predicted transcriptional regulator YheO